MVDRMAWSIKRFELMFTNLNYLFIFWGNDLIIVNFARYFGEATANSRSGAISAAS